MLIARNVKGLEESVVLGAMDPGMRIAPLAVVVAVLTVSPAQGREDNVAQAAMDMVKIHGVINAVGAGVVDMLTAHHVMAQALTSVFHAMVPDIKIVLGVGDVDIRIVKNVMDMAQSNVNDALEKAN